MKITKFLVAAIALVSLSGCIDDFMNGKNVMSGGGDLDCSDFDGPVVIVDGYDPHGLDGDNDGIGCESN